jgi:hypothetical protein
LKWIQISLGKYLFSKLLNEFRFIKFACYNHVAT